MRNKTWDTHVTQFTCFYRKKVRFTGCLMSKEIKWIYAVSYRQEEKEKENNGKFNLKLKNNCVFLLNHLSTHILFNHRPLFYLVKLCKRTHRDISPYVSPPFFFSINNRMIPLCTVICLLVRLFIFHWSKTCA